jgi:hypothetical protein
MIRPLLAAALLSLTTPSAGGPPARELDIALGRSAFGLPLTAPERDFRRILGEPTAVFPMTDGRHALLYGNSVLLIFAHDRLWQARTWADAGWSPQIFHGWLQYVPAAPSAITSFSVDGKLRVGDRREAAEAAITGRDGDGDELSHVEHVSGADVWLGYAYDDDVATDEDRDVKRQRVVSLVVEFTSK